MLVYAFGFIAGYYYAFLMLYALWRYPPRPDLGSWLLVTSLLLPSAAAIALQGAELDLEPRYTAASVLLLVTWCLLLVQVRRDPTRPRAARPSVGAWVLEKKLDGAGERGAILHQEEVAALEHLEPRVGDLLLERVLVGERRDPVVTAGAEEHRHVESGQPVPGVVSRPRLELPPESLLASGLSSSGLRCGAPEFESACSGLGVRFAPRAVEARVAEFDRTQVAFVVG